MGVTDGDPFTAPIGTATYTVTGADEFGCENVASIEATVHQILLLRLPAKQMFGMALVTFNGGGALTYTWSPDAVTDGVAYSPTETGTYTVTGTDAIAQRSRSDGNCSRISTSRRLGG